MNKTRKIVLKGKGGPLWDVLRNGSPVTVARFRVEETVEINGFVRFAVIDKCLAQYGHGVFSDIADADAWCRELNLLDAEIQKWNQAAIDWQDKHNLVIAEVERLAARVKKLEEALRPFAEYMGADECDHRRAAEVLRYSQFCEYCGQPVEDGKCVKCQPKEEVNL